MTIIIKVSIFTRNKIFIPQKRMLWLLKKKIV